MQVEIIDNFLDIQDQLQISNYINNNSYLENSYSYSFNVNAVTQDGINSNNLLQINNPQMVKPIFDIEANTKMEVVDKFHNSLSKIFFNPLKSNHVYHFEKVRIINIQTY